MKAASVFNSVTQKELERTPEAVAVSGSLEAWGNSGFLEQTSGAQGAAPPGYLALGDAVQVWINSLKDAQGLSSKKALKREVNEQDISLESNSKPVRLVGMSKVRSLLKPRHKWFADRQGEIVEWQGYECTEFPRPVFAYPSLSLVTDQLNPYRLSVKAGHSAMKSLRVLGDVLAINEIRGVKVLDFTFTFPGELTKWLAGQNHGFTRDSEDLAWKLWREFWGKPVFKGRGKNRVKVLPSLEEFLSGGIDGKLGSHVNLHIWSTKDPGRAHWHFHVLLVNQSYADGKFQEIDHYLEGEKLEGLKRLWKARLLVFAREHNVRVPSLKGKALPVVYFQFIDWFNRSKVIHKWAYVNRAPIEDFAIFSNGNLSCADPPDWLVEYSNRARAFGWFRKFGEIIGKEVCKAMAENNKEKTCPACGGKLKKVGTFTNADMAAMAERGTLYSTEWVEGKLRSVPLSKGDIDFLRG